MISYPNVLYPRACRATVTRGYLPDSILLEFDPQAGTPAADGDLRIYDVGQSITFRKCHLNFASIRHDQSGQVVHCRLWDRRYWWRYGEINGAYNVPNPDGTINAATQVSVRDLAVLLLDAQGETGYDVSALPDDVYPATDWDCDNPMQELWELCQQHGYEICWTPQTDVVKVYAQNDGASLPNDVHVKTVSYSVTGGESPASIALRGAKVSYQSKWAMEAVGEDTDGSIVPIDDLSYAPEEGWTYTQGTRFDDIADEFGEDERQLAIKSVFKWYRATTQADGTEYVLGTPVPLGECLPFERTINDTYTDSAGYQRYQAPYLEGVFTTGADDKPTDNTDDGALVEDSFEFVHEVGLVKLPRPYVKRNGDDMVQAELYLTAAYARTNPATNQKYRYQYNYPLTPTSPLAGPLVVVREELVNTGTARYSGGDPRVVTSVDDNTSDVDASAELIVAQIVQEFGAQEAFTVSYRTLRDIRIDGAIWQVTWVARMATEGAEGGTDTIAGRMMEFEVGAMRSRDRRRLARALRRQRHSNSALFRRGYLFRRKI